MTSLEFDAWLRADHRPPLIMGVLNVTPDSFSDGGQHNTLEEAMDQAEMMAVAGVDLIDVGGESTRPGSLPVPVSEQIARVVPAIREIASRFGNLLTSIDTTRAQVAAASLDAGAGIINDISAGRDDANMLPLAAARDVPIVLMHMQGTPLTMQENPTYGDVTAEVVAFLLERRRAAIEAGVEPHRILFDPGLGFGKRDEHNLRLLKDTAKLTALGSPLLVGASRKGFIGRVTGEPVPMNRVFGTAAAVAWSIANGAGVVRVHDVGPMKRIVKMVRAIQQA